MTVEKGFTALVILCVLLSVFCFAFAGTAVAQDDDSGNYMERKGLDGLLSAGDYDEARAAKPWQIALGVGSIFVMIAVVKWL